MTLAWTTQHATGVDLAVDGPGIYGSYGPNGQTQVNVPCDGNPHTYTLTAKSATQSSAPKTITVTTHT